MIVLVSTGTLFDIINQMTDTLTAANYLGVCTCARAVAITMSVLAGHVDERRSRRTGRSRSKPQHNRSVCRASAAMYTLTTNFGNQMCRGSIIGCAGTNDSDYNTEQV